MIYGPPYTLYECTVNDLWSPIPYMECRNLITVLVTYGPSLFLIWKALSMTYGPPYMECTVNDLWSPIPDMECGNLYNCWWFMVPLIPYMEGTVNDLLSPIPYMECGNVITVSDLWSPLFLIWKALSMMYGPPYLICNVGTLKMGPPQCTILIFSGQLCKRTTACPNKVKYDNMIMIGLITYDI